MSANVKKIFTALRWACQLTFLGMCLFAIRFANGSYNKLLIIGMILLVGNVYCGWACPFGTIQDILSWINRRFIKFRIVVPQKYDKWLSWLRYVTLFVALGVIAKIINARHTFLFLNSGRAVTVGALVFMGVILLLGLFMDRPFCRYFCSEGARYGAISMARVFTVSCDPSKCVKCHACEKNCPMNIPVSESEGLNSPHCISCGRCLTACPKEGALKVKFRRLRDPITIVAILAGIAMVARMLMFASKHVR